MYVTFILISYINRYSIDNESAVPTIVVNARNWTVGWILHFYLYEK